MAEQPPKQRDPNGAAISDQDMATVRTVLRKTAWIVLALMIVGVLVFWIGWVRAPSPTQVCKHKIELVHETTGADQGDGADALVGQLEATCVIAAERKIRLRGKLVWAKYAKCVTSAASLSDAERC